MAKKKHIRHSKKRKSKKNEQIMILILIGIIILFIYLKEIFENDATIFSYLIIISVFIAISWGIFIILRKKYLEFLKGFRNSGGTPTIDQLIKTYKKNPTEFEKYIAELYTKQNFKTKVTPKTNDGGKDIIMSKNRKKYVVEVKLYSYHNKVGREPIQKLDSVAKNEKAKGIFITTSSFTDTAIKWAKQTNIELIDGLELTQMINRFNPDDENNKMNQGPITYY